MALFETSTTSPNERFSIMIKELVENNTRLAEEAKILCKLYDNYIAYLLIPENTFIAPITSHSSKNKQREVLSSFMRSIVTDAIISKLNTLDDESKALYLQELIAIYKKYDEKAKTAGIYGAISDIVSSRITGATILLSSIALFTSAVLSIAGILVLPGIVTVCLLVPLTIFFFLVALASYATPNTTELQAALETEVKQTIERLDLDSGTVLEKAPKNLTDSLKTRAPTPTSTPTVSVAVSPHGIFFPIPSTQEENVTEDPSNAEGTLGL